MSRPLKPQTSYRAPAMMGMFGLVVLLGGSLIWAATAEIASAVIASGSIVVEGKPQSVQHLDGGIVRRLLVRAGDPVGKDQPLMELDDTSISANLAIYERRLREALVLKERLIAELSGAETFLVPAKEAATLALGDLDASVRQQSSLMEARRLTRLAQLEQLDEKVAQIRNQIQGVAGLRQQKEQQVAAYDEEIEAVATLAEQRLAPKSQLLALRRSRADLLGQIAEQVYEAARLENAVSETTIAKLQVEREFREKATSELENATRDVDELLQQLTATRKQLERVVVRSPVSGIVHELNVFTIGGVVQPGQTVMQVIPQDRGNEIEVNVDIQSIDQVFLGQRAIVRFPAFHQHTTPEIDGTVAMISPSSVVDENKGTAFYRVGVRVTAQQLAKLGDQRLIPGMPIEAFLPTGSRTVLSYLLKPLSDQLTHVFREE